MADKCEVKEIYWEDGIYKGEVKDGIPNGKGHLQISKGYCYDCRNSSPDGKGPRYEGTFVDGKLEGEGICEWRDGTIYEGNFNGGRITGFGTIKFGDGRRYVGEMLNGKRHGNGKLYVMRDGEEVLEYEGKYKDDNVDISVSSSDLLTEIMRGAEMWSGFDD